MAKSFPKNSTKVAETNDTSKTFRNSRRPQMAAYKKPKNVGNRVHLLDFNEDEY